MDYKNLMYNINGNTLVQDKMKRNKELLNIICRQENPSEKGFTNSEIEKLGIVINGCKDSGDYVSLILSIPIRDDQLFHRYLYTFYTVVYLFTQSNYEISEGNYNTIKDQFKLIEGIISSNESHIDDVFVTRIMDKLGEYINTIGRAVNGITTDYVYYLSPKTIKMIETMNEAIGDSDSSDNRITSPSDPDGCKTSVDINLCDNPIDYIMDLIREDDHDYFIHKIGRIYNFLLRLEGDYSNDYTKVFIEVVNFTLSKVIGDITGKEILLDTLSKCDQLLSDNIPASNEIYENTEIMISKIEEITNIISENPEGDTSLLDEMGLGYIYDVFPKDGEIENLSEAVEFLNRYAEDNNMLSVISESIEILNEGIKDRIKETIDRHKERRQKDKEFEEKKKDEKYQIHDDTYDTRVDISRRRQNDEYDLERDKVRDKYEFDKNFSQQKKHDKYSDTRALKNQDTLDKQDLKEQKRQDKYDAKLRKKQDKYDFKQQKKLDKYEEKKRYAEDKKRQAEDDRLYARELAEKKRQERLEARQRKRDETKIGLNRWKTLELTNANARKAANAVRKAVKAGAAAGVGALAGINPIFAGAAYLMTSYIKDKTHPRADRKKVIDEMKTQLAEIDEKIDQCSRKGEDDKKVALIKMKRKLETAYGRAGIYNTTESELVEERRHIAYR